MISSTKIIIVIRQKKSSRKKNKRAKINCLVEGKRDDLKRERFKKKKKTWK